MTELRVVFETSVAVSAALLPRSVPRQAFDTAVDAGRLLLSEASLAELDEVLRRPKFVKYVAERSRLEFLLLIVNTAEVVPVTHHVSECRDPKDDKFLELALSGQATHIVSGDADLLEMHPFRGVTIVGPQEFLNLARK